MNCYDMRDYEEINYHAFTHKEILGAINNGHVIINNKKYKTLVIKTYPELKYFKEMLRRTTNDMRMGYAPNTFPILYKTIVYEDMHIFVVNNFEKLLSTVQDSVNIERVVSQVNEAIKYMARKGYTLYNLTIFNVYVYDHGICINLFDNCIQTLNKMIPGKLALSRFINTLDKKNVQFTFVDKNKLENKIRGMFNGLGLIKQNLTNFTKFELVPGVFYARSQFDIEWLFKIVLQNLNPATIPSIKTHLRYLDIHDDKRLEFYTWYIILLILLINHVDLDTANNIAKGRININIDNMISKIIPCVNNTSNISDALRICETDYKIFVAPLAGIIFGSDMHFTDPFENWLENYL